MNETEQLEMFEPHKHARRSDPRTSYAAAHSLSLGRYATELQAIESAYHNDYGLGDGLTSDEACEIAGFPNAWRRVSDLVGRGIIEDTGRTRPGKSGREQRVLMYVMPEDRRTDDT